MAQQCSRSTITQSHDNNHKIVTITILIMTTITSQPSALAWPMLHPWTPRRGFFWLAWTTVSWKFLKNEPPDLSFIKSDIWLFFEPGKPLGLWSRQQCSSQRASLPGTWAGSRKDCPGDFDDDHDEPEKGSDRIAFLATSSTFTVYFWPTLRSSPATPSWKIENDFFYFLCKKVFVFRPRVVWQVFLQSHRCPPPSAERSHNPSLKRQSTIIIPAWKGNSHNPSLKRQLKLRWKYSMYLKWDEIIWSNN